MTQLKTSGEAEEWNGNVIKWRGLSPPEIGSSWPNNNTDSPLSSPIRRRRRLFPEISFGPIQEPGQDQDRLCLSTRTRRKGAATGRVSQILEGTRPPSAGFIACTPIRVIKINYPRFILSNPGPEPPGAQPRRAIPRGDWTGKGKSYLRPFFYLPCVAFRLILMTVEEPKSNLDTDCGSQCRCLRGCTGRRNWVSNCPALKCRCCCSSWLIRAP